MSETQTINAAAPAIEDSAVIDVILEELAGLDEIAYGQRRKIEADRLGIPVSFLDSAVKKRRVSNGDDGKPGSGRSIEFPEPNPWPEPVDGDALLDQIAATFNKYVVLPPGGVEVLALWTVHTHAFELR